MPRYDLDIGNLIGESSKIRKRGCSTSSSSSSRLYSYRFKRAVLVNNRGRGSSFTPLPTPLPAWKTTSPSTKGKQPQVSARKLAATLWEMNEVPSSSRLKESSEEKIINKETRSRRRKDESSQSSLFWGNLSDPSHSPLSQNTGRSCAGSAQKRSSARSQRLWRSDRYNGGFGSPSNSKLLEIEKKSRGCTPPGSVLGVKTSLKDLSNGLITCKELLKILGRIWGVEEYKSSAKSLVLALHNELDRAHSQVGQLIQEQPSDNKEVNYLMKHFAEEKAAWKSKMQERIDTAVKVISSDLEIERKLRRRTESLNKTLARELAETKIALSKSVKELECEKRAREIVEEACNELARGIGEDRAEVEQMKKESVKVLKEVEKEREMLHVADVLREERVQMKLLEAKYQFEEKNAAVEKLKNDLEAFLKAKKAKENQHGTGEYEGELESGEDFKDVDPEEGSTESDLHSIELNMDNNNRSYMWSYAASSALDDRKRLSTEKETKGRKSTSEKIEKGRNSLDRYMSNASEWGINAENFPVRGNAYGRERYSKIEKQAHGEDFEAGSLKGLRDHILSTSRLAPSKGFVSPTRQWGQV